MEKMDIRKLLKCYEEEYPKCLTVEGYLDEYSRRCYRPDKDLGFQIHVICIELQFCSAGKQGIYRAFKTGDIALLNDALFQRACEAHLHIAVHSGYDHSQCYGNVLPTAMAANLFERVPLLAPKQLGMAKNGYKPYVAAMNLFMALWYKEPDFIEYARKEAAAKLKTKMNRFDRASIAYLLALLDGKTEEASRHLKEMCEGIKRLDSYYTPNFDKAFCIAAHGLYNLARQLGIEGVEMPDADNFSKELALWQSENGSKPGKLFLEYPAPFELADKVLSVTPPIVTLYAPYPNDNTSLKHRRDIDATAFRDKVEADVLGRMGLSMEACTKPQ